MIKLSTIFWQEKNKEEKRRASMMRELLDRSPCSNTSRREKEGGDDPWRSNDFTARLHVRFGGRPRNFLE